MFYFLLEFLKCVRSLISIQIYILIFYFFIVMVQFQIFFFFFSGRRVQPTGVVAVMNIWHYLLNGQWTTACETSQQDCLTLQCVEMVLWNLGNSVTVVCQTTATIHAAMQQLVCFTQMLHVLQDIVVTQRYLSILQFYIVIALVNVIQIK